MINQFDISCIIEPCQKRGGLFQGSIITATNMAALNQYDIKCVLSVCSEFQVQYGPEINNLILSSHDYPNFDIIKLFDQAHNFLDQSRQYTNVLVHCHAGKSRSAAVVISYLMKKRNMNLEQALQYVKQQRSIVNPNPGFIKQLLLYEQQIFGKITSVLSDKITPYFFIQQQLQVTQIVNSPEQYRLSIKTLDQQIEPILPIIQSPQKMITHSSPYIFTTPPQQIKQQTQREYDLSFTTPQVQNYKNQEIFHFNSPIQIPFTVPISKDIIPAFVQGNSNEKMQNYDGQQIKK